MHKTIYPFANLDIGDTFLYNFAPFMKIGKHNARGKFCDMEVNAVSLLQGECIHFDKSDKVMLVENIWKGFSVHEKQNKYKEEKEKNQKLRAIGRCEDTVSDNERVNKGM